MATGGDRGRQEATGGDRGRQEETGGDRWRQVHDPPPAHAEHAGIRLYGARRCNGGGFRCFAILQFVFNSSTSSC